MSASIFPRCVLIRSICCSPFSSNTSAPISEGATALKLENEIQQEEIKEVGQFEETNNEILGNTLTSEESSIDNTEQVEEVASNGLENFEIEEETPGLFNSDVEENSTEAIEDIGETDNLDEEDLEIPAFLRRQKN